MPENIDDRTRIDSARGRISEGKVRFDRREDGKLNYRERVAVIWIEKVKSMGPCTLNGVEGRRGCAEDTRGYDERWCVRKGGQDCE